MRYFDYILQGHEATEENAILAAQGLDWSGIEEEEQVLSFMRYVTTENGIDIWYCYGADYYAFSDATL